MCVCLCVCFNERGSNLFLCTSKNVRRCSILRSFSARKLSLRSHNSHAIQFYRRIYGRKEEICLRSPLCVPERGMDDFCDVDVTSRLNVRGCACHGRTKATLSSVMLARPYHEAPLEKERKGRWTDPLWRECKTTERRKGERLDSGFVGQRHRDIKFNRRCIKVLSVVVHVALKRAGGTHPVHHTYWKSSVSPTWSSV